LDKEEFRAVCDLFGGQTATSRLLGLASSRNLRKVIKGDLKVPSHWVEKLKLQSIEKVKELQRFYES